MKSIYKGFTLIEVIVVIAIIGIMSSIMLAMMAENRIRSQVEAAAIEFSARLRTLQNDSLVGKFDSSGIACGYVLDTSATSYKVSYAYAPTCANVVNLCTASEKKMIYQTNIPNGVKVSPAGSGVCFTIPFGKVLNKDGGGFTGASFTFTKGPFSSRAVNVCKTGDIKIGKECQ